MKQIITEQEFHDGDENTPSNMARESQSER